MARIKEGYYSVELLPEGITEYRYIYDDGEYTVKEETPNGKVFEGGFGNGGLNHSYIVSQEWMNLAPSLRYNRPLKCFRLIARY